MLMGLCVRGFFHMAISPAFILLTFQINSILKFIIPAIWLEWLLKLLLLLTTKAGLKSMLCRWFVRLLSSIKASVKRVKIIFGISQLNLQPDKKKRVVLIRMIIYVLFLVQNIVFKKH